MTRNHGGLKEQRRLTSGPNEANRFQEVADAPYVASLFLLYNTNTRFNLNYATNALC